MLTVHGQVPNPLQYSLGLNKITGCRWTCQRCAHRRLPHSERLLDSEFVICCSEIRKLPHIKFLQQYLDVVRTITENRLGLKWANSNQEALNNYQSTLGGQDNLCVFRKEMERELFFSRFINDVKM